MQQVKNTCRTCGTQYSADTSMPDLCPICSDDRQYFTDEGQVWTNTTEIITHHKISITELTPSLYALQVTPLFAIGQRALLVLSPGGNVLWDCIPLLNQEIIDFIRLKGGLKAIAM
jgi:hypothetical protein